MDAPILPVVVVRIDHKQAQEAMRVMQGALNELNRLKEINQALLAACKMAQWIQDRLIEKGSYGSGFEEWEEISKVVEHAEEN